MAMNAYAVMPGLFITANPPNLKRLLNLNASKGIYRHGTGALIEELRRYSRFADFTLHARETMMAVLQEHEVEIDAEAYFLMSVMHSLDHHNVCRCSDPKDLYSPRLGYGGAEWIRVLFSEPLTPILADTRPSRQKSPWMVELHRRLHAIDPELADRVDCGIRY